MKTFSWENVISNIFFIFLTFRDFRLIGSNSNVSFRVDSYSTKPSKWLSCQLEKKGTIGKEEEDEKEKASISRKKVSLGYTFFTKALLANEGEGKGLSDNVLQTAQGSWGIAISSFIYLKQCLFETKILITLMKFCCILAKEVIPLQNAKNWFCFNQQTFLGICICTPAPANPEIITDWSARYLVKYSHLVCTQCWFWLPYIDEPSGNDGSF